MNPNDIHRMLQRQYPNAGLSGLAADAQLVAEWLSFNGLVVIPAEPDEAEVERVRVAIVREESELRFHKETVRAARAACAAVRAK